MRRYCATAAKVLTDIDGNTDWEFYTQFHEVEKCIPQRLWNAQYYRDQDYFRCVLSLFNNVIEDVSEEKGKDFINHILSDLFKNIDEEIYEKNKPYIDALTSNFDMSTFLVFSLNIKKYINLDTFPDDFYRDLQNEINKAYNYKLYSVIPVLTRKFIENLIIDIFRKKYGTTNIELYFDTFQRKCHNFSNLVTTLSSKLSDFNHIEKNFNNDMIKEIEKFRETGNANAHSITVKFTDIEVKKIEDNSSNLEHILKLLIRVLNLL